MRRRAAGALVTVALLVAACTGTGIGGPTPPPDQPTSRAQVPPSPESVLPAGAGPDSAARAARRLCEVPTPDLEGGTDVPAEGPTPPVIAEVMGQVERIRGFDYTHPVVAQPVSQEEIGADLVAYADLAYPAEQYARRSLAWDTIGVIPDGTSLRQAYESYGGSQVIGYYDTLTGKLKFIGSHSPSPLERITLAHELTHAIDDQRFGLEKLDVLGAECRDEDLAASVALVEGNATFFMLRWARTFLTATEQVQVGIEAATQEVSTEGIPPFIQRLQSWSYDGGLRFISTLEATGGLDAVDEAFVEPPASTEQIIHPERYPNDAPTPVDVPNLSEELGRGWEDIDVMTIGESWLALALGLRLDGSEANAAAAGWDGGTYRAWSNGDDVAVLLATVWDNEPDAADFAAAMGEWIDAGEEVASVSNASGNEIWAFFATDAETLEALEAAATGEPST